MALVRKMRDLAARLRVEIRVYQLVLKDRRTPLGARLLLALAVGYTFLPFDIIPDFIPVIGHLDDVIIVPALVLLALRMIPREVLDDCRARAGLPAGAQRSAQRPGANEGSHE